MTDAETFWGKEYSDKVEAFEKELLNLDLKYNDWFKRNQVESGLDEPESIVNHRVLVYGNQTVFHFPDCTLPEYIRKDAFDIFNKHFRSE